MLSTSIMLVKRLAYTDLKNHNAISSRDVHFSEPLFLLKDLCHLLMHHILVLRPTFATEIIEDDTQITVIVFLHVSLAILISYE